MKKLITTFSVLAVALALFVGIGMGQNAHAAVSDEGEVQSEDIVDTTHPDEGTMVVMPSISIDSVTLNSQQFKAGEQISGSFTITNHSTILLEKAAFRVLVGENYEDPGNGVKMTGSFLDASGLSAVGDIKAEETKKVDFTYKIPAFISGQKLAVQINAYTNNAVPLGGNSSDYIDIEKSSGSISVTNVKLVLSNGKEYNLTEGPTIFKDKDPKTAAVSVAVKNETNSDVAIIPKVSAYNQQDRLARNDSVAPIITLNPGESKDISIGLPTMEYKSGVYFAEITLADASGNQLASRIGVRYIVGGDMATIHSVQSDKTEVDKGEELTISYVITGMPSDISIATSSATSTSGSSDLVKKDGQISINLFNELNQPVAEIIRPFSLVGENIEKVVLTANQKAKALKAVVSIYNQEGFAFLTKAIYISSDFEAVANQEALIRKAIAAGAVVLLIIIVLLAYFLFRRKKISAAVLSIVIFASTLAVPTITTAWTWSGTTYNCAVAANGDAPSVTINTPYDNQMYTENQPFNLSGSVYYLACTNSPNYLTLNFSNSANGESGNRLIHSSDITGGHYSWYETEYFMSKTLHAGSKPGQYYVYFYIFDGCYRVNGYVPYRVRCAPGRTKGADGYCTSSTSSTSGTTAGGSSGKGSGKGSGSGSTVTTTNTSLATCGPQSSNLVTTGTAIAQSGSTLCTDGTNSSLTFNYTNSLWKWTCVSQSGANSSYCSAWCDASAPFCPATGVCSADCVDWCPDSIPGNPAGNQPDRNLYNVGANGECTQVPLISKYDLKPALTDSSGTCKAFWTINSISNINSITCAVNGVTVPCTNTTGYGVKPGTAKLVVTATAAKSSITDTKELKCTQNPSVVEF